MYYVLMLYYVLSGHVAGFVSVTLDGSDYVVYNTRDLEYWPSHQSSRIALQFKVHSIPNQS